MKVTKLEYQKKDPKRVNVYVDEKFVAGLNANDIIKLGLYAGLEITEQELSKITRDSEFGKYFNSALNFLSYRPRSEWEIRQHVIRHSGKYPKGTHPESLSEPQSDSGVPRRDVGIPRMTEQVVDKLKQIGQVDDEAFVRWFIDQRTTFRPEGKRALKFELSRKGIAKETIAKLLDCYTSEGGEEESEVSLAMRAAEKKARLLSSRITDRDSQFKAKIKLRQFLLSRGFDFDTVKEVVEKLLKKRYN